MITASLILNIAVLIPVCYFMLINNFRMVKTLGEFNPSRGILLAIYITILLASILLIFFADIKLAFALFFMQIVYKLLSPFTVKTLRHPFVISNIFIAIFHLVTIYTMIKADALHFDFWPKQNTTAVCVMGTNVLNWTLVFYIYLCIRCMNS